MSEMTKLVLNIGISGFREMFIGCDPIPVEAEDKLYV